MKGSLENAITCRHKGGLPPLGYSVDSKTQLYLINEETAPIIRFIFEGYINGKGYNDIINELNKRGLKTPKGNKFTVSTIKDILKNEKYIGTYTYNKAETKNVDGKRNSHRSKKEDQMIKIEGGMPTIILKKFFEEVKRIMARNKKIHNTYNAKEIYLLSGLIECGECGAKMNGNISYYKNNGEKLRYIMYRCTAKARESKEHIKKFISLYVEKVLVFEDYVDVVFKLSPVLVQRSYAEAYHR